jgi:hypothetical protein
MIAPAWAPCEAIDSQQPAMVVSDGGSNMKLKFVRSIGTGTRPAP